MSVTAVPIRLVKKGSVAKLMIGLLLLCLLAAGLAWAGTAAHIYTTTASGLQYRVVKEGEGASPTIEDVALIDYTGRLADGTVFDTSKGKQPIPLPVRPGSSIAGFSEALQLMKKGGIYRLRIPYKLAYGEEGQPPSIPPKADLDFDVTLLDFLPEAALQAMMPPQGGPGGAGDPGGPGGPGDPGAPGAPEAGPGGR